MTGGGIVPQIKQEQTPADGSLTVPPYVDSTTFTVTPQQATRVDDCDQPGLPSKLVMDAFKAF